MHAHAAESLLPYLKPGSRVLDIGSGSGYLTHVFAELVFPSSKSNPLSSSSLGSQGAINNSGDVVVSEIEREGRVVGLEHISALKELGERNMEKSEEGRKLLKEGKVQFVKGDGRKGWVDDDANEKGWDAIHVGAAAVTLHEELISQLRSPGRYVVIPFQFACLSWPEREGRRVADCDTDCSFLLVMRMVINISG